MESECKWMQSSMQISNILALQKKEPAILMSWQCILIVHPTMAWCGFFFYQKGQASRFFFFGRKSSDFILNSKFMILDKKSIGHNDRFSLEYSCRQWGLLERPTGLGIEPYKLWFKILPFAWAETWGSISPAVQWGCPTFHPWSFWWERMRHLKAPNIL